MRLRKNGPNRTGLIDQLLDRKPRPHLPLVCHTCGHIRRGYIVSKSALDKGTIIAQMLCFRDNFQFLRVEIPSTARHAPTSHRNNQCLTP